MPQFGINVGNTLNPHIDTPVRVASMPERRGAIPLPQPLPSRNVCCIPVPPHHRNCKAKWPVPTPRCPFLRFASSFERICLVLSWPPPLFPFLLALPTCRMRGHEIDSSSILWGVFLAFYRCFVTTDLRYSTWRIMGMENRASGLNRDAPDAPVSDSWEAAYLRFETPQQEIQKFIVRLNRLGAIQWPRDAEIVELFCGRGNGLIALERLGFTRIEGVDLSPRLLAQFKGSAKCTLADCRQLPFAARTKAVLIVQ